MCFNQSGDIFPLNVSSQKIVDTFIYLGSSVSSSEHNISMQLAKALTAIVRLSVIWKSDLSIKIKCKCFQAAIVHVHTTERMHHLDVEYHLKKKLDCKRIRMLRAILNKSWKQHLTKHQLHNHLPPISKNIQIKRTRHVGYCKRARTNW